MTIVEISNLFNLITAMHPNLNSYHFGWPSDINRNVANNYDSAQETGTLYPHVQWAAPVESTRLDLVEGNEYLNINLYFYDLMLRDSAGALRTKTMIEHWRDLRLWAMQFIREVNRAGRMLASQGKGVMIEGNLQWMADGHVENDNLIMVGVSFTLFNKMVCNDLNLDYTSSAPAGHSWPPATTDTENIY